MDPGSPFLFCPKNFGLKKIWVQIAFRVQKILSFKNLLAKKVLCPNKLCFKKDLLQKYFESKTNIRWIEMLVLKKILGPKKFWVQKNFGSKKVLVHRIMGRKKCWSQTNLGPKKRFWLWKKFGHSKSLDLKEFWYQGNFCPKIFVKENWHQDKCCKDKCQFDNCNLSEKVPWVYI